MGNQCSEHEEQILGAVPYRPPNSKNRIFIANTRIHNFKICGGVFTVLLGDTHKTAIPVWEVKYKILCKSGLVKVIAKSLRDRKRTICVRTKEVGDRHEKGEFHIQGTPFRGEINIKHDCDPDNPLISIALGELSIRLYKDTTARRIGRLGYSIIRRNATADYRLVCSGKTIAVLKYPNLVMLFENVRFGMMHIGEFTLCPRLLSLGMNEEFFWDGCLVAIVLYRIALPRDNFGVCPLN